MFVVLERNQAGGTLELPPYSGLHRDREDAVIERDRLTDQAREVGRRDRYVLAAVELVEDDED